MPCASEQARAQLALLFAGAQGLLELRWRGHGRWRQRFLSTAAIDAAAACALRRSARADVYIGVLARRRRGGGHADLVDHARVVWADSTTPAGWPGCAALSRRRRW
jgi:hypothetical protein